MNVPTRQPRPARFPAWQLELCFRAVCHLCHKIARRELVAITTLSGRPADPRTKPGKPPERLCPPTPAGSSRQVGRLMEQFTPKAVYDLYCLLPDDDKRIFLKLLASVSTAEVPFVITNELPLEEKGRYAEMM